MTLDRDWQALFNEQQTRGDGLELEINRLHEETEARLAKNFKHGEVSGLEMAADVVMKKAIDAWTKQDDAKASLLRSLSVHLAEMAKARK